MNYTINYPSGGNIQIGNSIPVASQGQRTIVLTPPGQNGSNTSGNINNNNNQSSVPIVMQVGNANTPVFYTYLNNEGIVNSSIQNKTTEVHNGIGQVVLSAVSPGQSGLKLFKHNSTSLTISSMNLQAETKQSVARSLGDVFGMQSIGSIPSQGAVIVNNAIQGNGNQNNSELATMISSLQAAGLQIVETVQGNNNSSIPVSVIQANHHQSGMQLIENNTENALGLPVTTTTTIGIPASSSAIGESNVIGENAANVAVG